VAISVTPWLFSVAAVAKTIASDTSELNAHPGNGIDADAGELRSRPRRGLSRMHRTVETAGDADTPPAMSSFASATALALVMLLGVTYWRWLGYL